MRPIVTRHFDPYVQLLVKRNLVAKSTDAEVKVSTKISLGSSSSDCHPILRSKVYEKRNVYKSIVRHMHNYFKENNREMTSILRNNGFEEEEIKRAYQLIKQISERQKVRGTPKKPKKALSIIISTKNIYTYILKETLSQMLNQWAVSKHSRVRENNIPIYKAVCQKYYKKCIDLLSQSKLNAINIL